MTMIVDDRNAELTITGFKPSENRRPLTVIPTSVGTGGTTEDRALGDSNWVLKQGQDLEIGGIVQSPEAATFRSADPALATVDDNGVVTRVYGGGGNLSFGVGIIAGMSRVTERVSVTVGHDLSGSNERFVSYNDGSLAKALSDCIDGIAAAAPSLSAPYSSGQLTIPSDPRNAGRWNPHNWCYRAGVDLSPISVWMSHGEGGGWWGGNTLIHPRFGVAAKHYPACYTVGVQVQFRSLANVNYTTTIVAATTQIGESTDDIALVQYDPPLPSDIRFARVLPDNWHDYLPAIVKDQDSHFGNSAPAPNFGIGGILRNRNDFLATFDWFRVAADIAGLRGTSRTFEDMSYVPSSRTRYCIQRSAGDSSNGACLIHPHDKSLIVFAPPSWMLNYHRAEVNAWMASKVDGASLTDADFSMYPNYS